MPELPEVETLKNQLNSVLPGKTIKNIIIKRDKNFIGESSTFLNQKVSSVKRKAKVLIFTFGKDFPLLIIHLKMTGQLIFENGQKRVFGGHPNDDFFNSLPSKYTRVIIEFTDKSKLYFNDQRTFGWLKVIKNKEEFDNEFKKLCGLAPFDKDNFTWQNLKKTFAKSNQAIKVAILDQSKIAGLGNIYANDSLFDANINPNKKACDLTDKQWQKLAKSIVKILQFSIDLGGTSQSTYLHLDGKKGNYQDHFLVYRKESKPCPICHTKIKKIKLGGRSTFFCPKCQK